MKALLFYAQSDLYHDCSGTSTPLSFTTCSPHHLTPLTYSHHPCHHRHRQPAWQKQQNNKSSNNQLHMAEIVFNALSTIDDKNKYNIESMQQCQTKTAPKETTQNQTIINNSILHFIRTNRITDMDSNPICPYYLSLNQLNHNDS